MASLIFYRLSDRNTRNGIQLFEDFCKSGHIESEDIMLIRTVGNDSLPHHKFLNALLRRNRKYFNGEESNFVNLFYSNPNDDFPDPFVRIDILLWLKSNNDKEGPSKTKGMFPVKSLLKELQLAGHKSLIVRREINYLLKRCLIISESLQITAEDNDLIKITLPGLLHLTLLSNVTYLAACAEDVQFKNVAIMTAISRRIACSNYLSKLSAVLTANDLISYLEKYRTTYSVRPEAFLADEKQSLIFDLEACKCAISNCIERDQLLRASFMDIQSFTARKKVTAEVVKKESMSLLCAICDGESSSKGFISAYEVRKYGLSFEQYEQIRENDRIECEVIEYDIDHRSFQLRFISKLSNVN